MKRHMAETAIRTGRGSSKVITYGYSTKIPGLDIIRVVSEGKIFAAIHTNSGYSLGIYDESAMKIKKFVEKYLTDFNFLQNKYDLTNDEKLGAILKTISVIFKHR